MVFQRLTQQLRAEWHWGKHNNLPFSFPWHHIRPNRRIWAQFQSQTFKGKKDWVSRRQVKRQLKGFVKAVCVCVSSTYFKDKHLTSNLWPKCSLGTSGTQWRSMGSSWGRREYIIIRRRKTWTYVFVWYIMYWNMRCINTIWGNVVSHLCETSSVYSVNFRRFKKPGDVTALADRVARSS